MSHYLCINELQTLNSMRSLLRSDLPKVTSRSKNRLQLIKGVLKIIGLKFLFDWILIGTSLYVTLLVFLNSQEKEKKVLIVLTIMMFMLICREILQALLTRRLYIYSPGNWIQMFMIITGNFVKI